MPLYVCTYVEYVLCRYIIVISKIQGWKYTNKKIDSYKSGCTLRLMFIWYNDFENRTICYITILENAI